MRTFQIRLSDDYPELSENGADPRVRVYLQEDIEEGDCKATLRISPRPAMLILPGGGYHHVGRREGEPIALEFMSLGFQCFILEYSVVPHTYPRALRELTALIQLVCSHADAWNIDPQKLVLCGFSAGGHLAASYCTIRDREEITGFLSPQPVCAAILAYPVISATVANYHRGSYRNLLGSQEPALQQLEEQSLDRYVSKALTPPTFLWHTAADRSVPCAGSLRYGLALAEAGIPYEMHIFPAGRHGLGTADRQGVHDPEDPDNRYVSQWITLAKGWLKQYIL